MIRLTKLDRAQISEFAKSPQQIKYFEALQTNVSELPEAIAILTAAVAEAQDDADIATTSAHEALTLANQKTPDDFLPEMVMQPIGGGDAISSATIGATTKATPVDADLIPLIDSAAGYTLKNLTWANLKATLKTYFDSVVTTLTNKTIALGDNTISGTLAQFNTAVTDADFASLAGVETLTNKTIDLTSNTLVATSAQLAAALTDETGTGAAVFAGSPALTGTPTAPTAAAGTNTTQLATTAHVFAERTNSATLTNKTLTSPVISGGTIDNASVGATTASTGRFTTVTTTTTGSTIVVDSFTAPTFLNSWVDFGGAFNTAGYYKDPFGIVHLRGLVKSGVVNTPIFNLPAGYRPTATEVFVTDSNSAHAQVTVSAAGNVTLAFGSNVYASLDGMTFKAV